MGVTAVLVRATLALIFPGIVPVPAPVSAVRVVRVALVLGVTPTGVWETFPETVWMKDEVVCPEAAVTETRFLAMFSNEPSILRITSTD
jgi:hypothetical protein